MVIDPQILFDKITDLIVKTFTCKNAEVNEIEDFQRPGNFLDQNHGKNLQKETSF